ncbi:MAG: hypothetical protein RIT81_12700 [Deltaproteobacteria bacterium]
MDPIAVFALSVGAYAVYELARFRRRKRNNATEVVCGHVVVHEHRHLGTRSVGGRRIDIWRNVTTIQGALPEWVSFGWLTDGGHGTPSDPNAVWAEILLGPAPMLSEGGTVYATHGDLVYETRPAPSPPRSAALVDAATPFLESKPDVVVELVRYVDAKSAPANAVAFSILARKCPDKTSARELAERHREQADVGLAAAIAAFEYPRGRERLLAIMNERASAEAKKIALRALVQHRDAEGLIAIHPSAVPSALAITYLEALGQTRRPEAETAALHFLEHEGLTETALDVLAAVGGRNSIPRLLALRSKGFDKEDALGLDTTIELVRGRIAEDGGARGTLSLADEGAHGGAVSLADAADGAVSLAGEGAPARRELGAEERADED